MQHSKHAVPAAGSRRNFIQGFGDPGRAVAYCRPVGMLQEQRIPDAGRCAKHDRAGPHATPLDPTAFP